jgi:hypothetical protein
MFNIYYLIILISLYEENLNETTILNLKSILNKQPEKCDINKLLLYLNNILLILN